MGPFDEIWVNTDDGQALCALINGGVGWLMYLRTAGDAGFSSRNPDYTGAPDQMIPYVLGNGQRDEFPASWALPIEVVRQALEHFRRTGRRPEFVRWHDDSADGTSL